MEIFNYIIGLLCTIFVDNKIVTEMLNNLKSAYVDLEGEKEMLLDMLNTERIKFNNLHESSKNLNARHMDLVGANNDLNVKYVELEKERNSLNARIMDLLKSKKTYVVSILGGVTKGHGLGTDSNWIRVIRVIRDYTMSSLLEAKSLVEQYFYLGGIVEVGTFTDEAMCKEFVTELKKLGVTTKTSIKEDMESTQEPEEENDYCVVITNMPDETMLLSWARRKA